MCLTGHINIVQSTPTHSYKHSYSTSIHSTFFYHTPFIHCKYSHQGRFGVPYLAKRHFKMETGAAGDQNINLQVRGRFSLPSAVVLLSEILTATLPGWAAHGGCTTVLLCITDGCCSHRQRFCCSVRFLICLLYILEYKFGYICNLRDRTLWNKMKRVRTSLLLVDFYA